MTATGPSGGDPARRGPQFGEDSSFFDGQTAVVVEPGQPVHATDEPVDYVDDDVDSEFAPQPRRRLGKLTIGLAALLVAGGGFLAGVQVQQHTTSSTAAGGFAGAAARRGTGTGAGGTGGTGAFGGAGGFAGGTRGGAATGTGAEAGTGGTTSGTTSTIPAIIGQIVSVSGDTVIVKNLGGKEITVKLSTTTPVTQTGTAADLKSGQNVTVSGSTGSDGTVTATSVATH
jgi:hypothetical protein